MKLTQIVLICASVCLCLCLCPNGGEALHLRQRRVANAAPDDGNLANELEAIAAAAADNDSDDDESAEKFVSDVTTTAQPLGIVSIKSRAIAMDRALCQVQSRYHPHYPKCHQYCKRLEHWIGQCWRESCHCIS
ncbi:uncharacterized protein LOC6566098 [Drosophila grimshawi]|uniref:GH24629 n=1 Tax=Drosophila grimshawi TaxID=7222 RepID=B4JMH5_DROGR|nr:uncharacterized protein LOC6566098 [Drosophila grimshawi]EDV91918.1 GH24629 [Drosophila grimshawi]